MSTNRRDQQHQISRKTGQNTYVSRLENAESTSSVLDSDLSRSMPHCHASIAMLFLHIHIKQQSRAYHLMDLPAWYKGSNYPL